MPEHHVVPADIPKLRLALMLVLALTGACSGDSGSGEADVGETSGADAAALAEAEATADPALNEAIVIGLPQLPRRFDPLDDLEPWALRISDDLVFEGLVRRTSDAYPWAEPAIADRCEVDREYAVASVVCHIPPGIRFHDGSELTMDDVVYSLGYWIDPRRVWIRQRHGLANLERIEIVDGPRSAAANERDPGRWIRLDFDKREPLALEALAALKIVPHKLHRASSTRFAQQPIGTGPMKLGSIAPDRISLERFADYHDPERLPPSGKLVFRALDDGAQALTALRRGEIHLLAELAPVHVPVELGKPGMAGRFQAWLVSPPHYDLLLWNVGEGSLALRRALHDAIPFSQIAREVFMAPGLPAEAPVDLHEPTPIDLDALADIKAGEAVRGGLLAMPSLDADAKGLTAAAIGLDGQQWLLEQGIRKKAGQPLRVTLTWDGQIGRGSSTFKLLEAAWKSVGVIVPEAVASWTYLLKLLKEGQFRVALLHMGGHSDEDLYHLFHSRGATNIARVDDAELDSALADYRGAPDRAARDAAKQRVAKRLAELRVVSLLYAPTHVTLASRRIVGLEFVDDLPRLDRLGLSPGDIDWGS